MKILKFPCYEEKEDWKDFTITFPQFYSSSALVILEYTLFTFLLDADVNWMFSEGQFTFFKQEDLKHEAN